MEITPSEPQALITCVGNPSFPTKVIWVHIWLLKLSLKFAQVLYVSLTSQSRPSVHEGRKGLPASLFPSPHQPSKAIQVGLIHLAPHKAQGAPPDFCALDWVFAFGGTEKQSVDIVKIATYYTGGSNAPVLFLKVKSKNKMLP